MNATGKKARKAMGPQATRHQVHKKIHARKRAGKAFRGIVLTRAEMKAHHA